MISNYMNYLIRHAKISKFLAHHTPRQATSRRNDAALSLHRHAFLHSYRRNKERAIGILRILRAHVWCVTF